MEVYSLIQAAKLIGVHYQTLRKEIDAKRLKAVCIGDRNKVGGVKWRISKRDLEQWWKQQGGEILPGELK